MYEKSKRWEINNSSDHSLVTSSSSSNHYLDATHGKQLTPRNQLALVRIIFFFPLLHKFDSDKHFPPLCASRAFINWSYWTPLQLRVIYTYSPASLSSSSRRIIPARSAAYPPFILYGAGRTVLRGVSAFCCSFVLVFDFELAWFASDQVVEESAREVSRGVAGE